MMSGNQEWRENLAVAPKSRSDDAEVTGVNEVRFGLAVYVRYFDHVLFKDKDPAAFTMPFVRETLGWLKEESDKAIQIIWERQANDKEVSKIKQIATGLVILKSEILEIKFLNGEGNAAALSGVWSEERDLRPSGKPGFRRGEQA